MKDICQPACAVGSVCFLTQSSKMHQNSHRIFTFIYKIQTSKQHNAVLGIANNMKVSTC
jgi:hypothetical protein